MRSNRGRLLLEGSSDVTALLESDPFAGKKPVFVRATRHRYRFATPEERARGLWWVREPEREYFPAVTLDNMDQARQRGLVDSVVRWRCSERERTSLKTQTSPPPATVSGFSVLMPNDEDTDSRIKGSVDH